MRASKYLSYANVLSGENDGKAIFNCLFRQHTLVKLKREPATDFFKDSGYAACTHSLDFDVVPAMVVPVSVGIKSLEKMPENESEGELQRMPRQNMDSWQSATTK